MIDNKNVLYIHGMGGGGDSRIPSILRDNMPEGVNVIVRTYSFDPETAWTQISSWLDELHPSVIVGESLGSLNAIRIKGLPHILVSPSLNAPLYLGHFAFLASLPGVTWLLDRIYKPREGDRQKLHFTIWLFAERPLQTRLRRAAGTVSSLSSADMTIIAEAG